jgi:hypothetical protein
MFQVRIGIKLRKELLYGGQPAGKGKRLVAVVTGPEIARLKKLGHRYLRHFFAVAKDAELGFASQHFLAAKQTGFAAQANPPVVLQHLFAKAVERQGFHRRLCCFQ